LVSEIFRQGDELELSLYDLSSRHDLRPLVLRTLLTYLELDGYLREGTPFYSQYRFKPLASSADILARFEGERRDFLRKLLSQAQKAKIWFNIDLGRAAQATGSPRERVVRALDYLGEQQLLELQVEGVRNRFRCLRRPQDPPALAADLHQRTLAREQREIARLNQVVELVEHNACQVSALGAHFGEPLPQPCGHCSWCQNGRRAVQLPVRAHGQIGDAQWREAVRARSEHQALLGEPRAFARFLCGLTSPKLSRARLSSNPLFGVFSDVPFTEVLRRAEG
jgi:ATP-dependent DNA helicase RecQ